MSAIVATSVVVWAATAPPKAVSVDETQTTGPAPVKLLIDSLAGPDLFRAYCATCHGIEGRGDGPIAGALTTRPSDLTSLTARNSGRFPGARVRALLSGDVGMTAVGAHGTAAMPVWGPIFRALEAGPQAEVRIENLVRYLEGLQR